MYFQNTWKYKILLTALILQFLKTKKSVKGETRERRAQIVNAKTRI